MGREKSIQLADLVIALKGAGEMASAVAWRLYMANLKKIVMLETANPLAVRRKVSFCEAVHEGEMQVEGVSAVCVQDREQIRRAWQAGGIAVVIDPRWRILAEIHPHVVVDAILAKRNLGTSKEQARLVIALGPGFCAGRDVHMVIETNRGHNLGRIITSGEAEPNTGIPGAIGGFTEQRVLRAPAAGIFQMQRDIGDRVRAGDIIGMVNDREVKAAIDGVLRGLIRPGSPVSEGMKIGDVDPRGEVDYCYTISDKARAIGGSVLEAILRVFNTGG